MPLIYHTVAATLIAVAIPFAARVRVPEAPVPAKYMVSLLAILIVVALSPAINDIAVPMG